MNRLTPYTRSTIRLLPALALLLSTAAFAQPDMSDAELALLREGVAFHNAGNFDAAIGRYQKALEIDATNAAAHHQIAFARFAQGDHERCLKAAEHGIEVADVPPAELYSMAGSCADELERYEVAALHFAAAVERFPTNHVVLYNTAIHKIRIQEPDEALSFLARSLDAQPQHASSHYAATMTLGFQGREDLAKLAGLRFLSLEPAGPRALEILGVLEALYRRNEVAQTSENDPEESAGSDGIDIGSVQVQQPQTEEEEQRLIDVVLSAAKASVVFSADGEPHFPDYARRAQIASTVAAASEVKKAEGSATEKRLATRYGDSTTRCRRAIQT